MIVGITGGTGFIGRTLVRRHLDNGDSVRLLTRKETSSTGFGTAVARFEGDLTSDSDSLEAFVDGVDVLYHCAGEVKNPSRMHAVHVGGTKRLIEASRGRIGRWTQLSSVGVYGSHRRGTITEETPANPQGVYEETKAESDKLVAHASEEGAFPYSMLRPSIVFGAGMTNQSLYGLIAAVERGIFFFIGKPGASANYIHVDNVIEALVHCGTKPAALGQTFNLSDWRSVEAFVGAIASALGKPMPKRRLPEVPVRFATRVASKAPGFPLTESRIDALSNHATYPSDGIERALGYRHIVSMEDGLHELVKSAKRA